METVFKKNEGIFLPKDAVSPLGGRTPAVYQEVGRQGPGASPLGWELEAKATQGTWALPSPSGGCPGPWHLEPMPLLSPSWAGEQAVQFAVSLW